uniref:Aspartate beta-hydroxylase n=1 Tax=Oreochromis niloticus TaxID=8128 RepID=I3K6Z0_ORENI
MYTEEEVEPLLEDETQPLVQETEGKTVPVESKNGKRTEGGGGGDAGGGPKYSVFTWFVVLGLLGVWSSVAVVYFNIVDYDTVIARAKEFRMNFSEVLQGKLTAYDTDGDGDFDVEDAKVLLGLTKDGSGSANAESLEEVLNILAEEGSDWIYGFFTFLYDVVSSPLEPGEEEEAAASEMMKEEEEVEEGGTASSDDGEVKGLGAFYLSAVFSSNLFLSVVSPAKKKKPKLLNKFDKTIKAEIDAAEKLRKKGKPDEALKAFERLVQQYPQSPRARYGKAQAEDDMAEKLRSNDMLQRAINTYREAAELPDVTSDLLRATLKRRAERQQFLGRMRGSLATLERLVQLFPEDIGLKNDLGVAHLLLGDNKGAKKIYEEVLGVAPDNGFAKVHYGFILKSENKIAESIPYLKEGLESGEPGTDDGRFYFHLGDALQRVGDNSAYDWYELGHKRGHFASLWQRSLYNVNGLKAQPWWTAKETGYTDLVKVLERNWKTIRDEALAVLDQNTGHFVPEEENLREKGDWGQYTLWQQGRKVGNACQGVPKTCALLERFPEATGCKRGQIKFSVMQPGTHVWPHTGPTNCRLRMHLGLVIPKRGCKIRCTNETRYWEEGKVLIFDDSFEHEVWQEAESYRLIFIVDVWHPELTQHQRQTLSPI